MTAPTMPEQAAHIARGLSAAQKKALLAMKAHTNWQAKPFGARWSMPLSALVQTDMFGRGRSDRWKLTALGLAVRGELKAAAVTRAASDGGTGGAGGFKNNQGDDNASD